MRDLALWADCREAAAKIRSLAHPATRFVWGYRPELNVLAGLRGATRFLDSQPLTGVLADRHLTLAPADRAVAGPAPPRSTHPDPAHLRRRRPRAPTTPLSPFGVSRTCARGSLNTSWWARPREPHLPAALNRYLSLPPKWAIDTAGQWGRIHLRRIISKRKHLLGDVQNKEVPNLLPEEEFTGYSSSDVARAAKVSLRLVRWWDEQRVVSPGHEGHKRI